VKLELSKEDKKYLRGLLASKVKAFVGITNDLKLKVGGDSYANTFGCLDWRFCQTEHEVALAVDYFQSRIEVKR
jgi:hypothetical protein